MNEINEILVNGALQILTIIIGLIVAGVRQWVSAKAEELKTKKTKEEFQIITDIAQTTVKYVEQVFKDAKGSEKLVRAIDKAQLALEEKGIYITDEQIKVFIESSVLEYNDWGIFTHDNK